MTYVGQQPATTFDSGIQERFTSLTTNTVTLNHEISAEEDILVVWNNIVQDKNTYSVGGTGNKTVTLGGTLVSADVVTVYYLNKVMQSVNPTAGSVGITELNVSDGSNGQALTTNGSGTLSFAAAGAALTGSTDNTVVTVTGANAMAGEANFTFDGEKAVLDSGSSNDTPALKIIQKGGYAGFEIEGDATNTGSAYMDIDSTGTGDSAVNFQSAGSHKWRIKNDYSDSHRMYVMDSDASAWVYLDQNDTSWNSSSDERLKTDWVNITNATDKINTLTKVGKFKRKQYDKENNKITDPSSSKEHYGLSAQEVEAILPELINEDVNGIKGMSYTELVPLLIKSIQELSARIKTLEDG